MSIDDDLQPQPSITEGDRALARFTDRYSFRRLMAERINAPPVDKILFFHGAGGNGKSLLLRKALGDSAAGNYRLRFQRYDFACIWYMYRKGKSLDEIRSLFPLNEVAGFATTAADALTGGTVGAVLKAFVDFGVQGWSERLTLQFAKQGVDKDTQARIRNLDVDRELIDELPGLFAEDLNAAMAQAGAPERIAFFSIPMRLFGERSATCRVRPISFKTSGCGGCFASSICPREL